MRLTHPFSVFIPSIHNAVVSVFQRKDLGENELYSLNEGVRLALLFMSPADLYTVTLNL